MTACSQPSVVLSFGGASHCVDSALATTGRRGALRAFAREAEQHFGLVPGKYSFVGMQGKIDSIERLEEELQESANGVCQLEICEREDGKMMRQMSAAMKALEERMEKKMEDALAGMRKEVDSNFRFTANEMQDLTTKMDALSEEALAARIDSLAGEDELKQRLDDLAQDCLAMREDSLLGEDAFTTRLDKIVDDLQGSSFRANIAELDAASEAEEARKTLEALEQQLQDEFDVMSVRELNACLEDDCEALRAEVRALAELPNTSAAPVTALAADLGNCSAVSPPKGKASGDLSQPNNRVVESLGFSMPPWAPMSKMSIPYSSKAIQLPQGVSLKSSPFDAEKRGLALDFGVGINAPFAHCTIAPKLRACRSSPVLAPLR